METDVSPKPLTLIQCWDDGVSTDTRLVDIFRRHGAKATFNLNAGLHEKPRRLDWIYQGTEVWKLGLDEMREVYSGFAIANHSLTHPHLDDMPSDAARLEIAEGRDRLEQFFGKTVAGFAYPFGTYNEAVMSAVRETGHVYARTVQNVRHPFPPVDAMAFHPCCHFLAPDFWERYERARDSAGNGGVFYFWGHSYELVTESMWIAFEASVARMSHDPLACWQDIVTLFTTSAQPAHT